MARMALVPLFLLLICYSTRTSGVNITTNRPVNSDGFLQMEMEESVSLVCKPDGDTQNEEEELVWLRNGDKINLKEGNKKGRSTICISSAIIEDNGANFTCYLHSNESDMASVTLNVTYRPQLNGSENIEVEKDETLVLQCDMRANPFVSSMFWTLNGNMLDLLAGGFTVTSDGSTSVLQVNMVEEGVHGGMYQCTATSPIYEPQSKCFNVTVTGKTEKFPLVQMIAGLVVVFLTALFAVISRWKKITKCCK